MDFREMVMKCSRYGAFVVISSMIATVAVGGDAKYGTGVSDKEIKIGNVAPYSGPASAYSAGAKTQAAYFRMINRQGGVKGRQLTFLSYDDAFSPPKTVEQTRRLVEQDDVFILFGSVGTATNSAYNPGATRTALFTVAGVLPIWQTGSTGSEPVCVAEPSTREVAGRPKPIAHTRTTSWGRAGVVKPGNRPAGPSRL